jgi:hypothetical protein
MVRFHLEQWTKRFVFSGLQHYHMHRPSKNCFSSSELSRLSFLQSRSSCCRRTQRPLVTFPIRHQSVPAFLFCFNKACSTLTWRFSEKELVELTIGNHWEEQQLPEQEVVVFKIAQFVSGYQNAIPEAAVPASKMPSREGVPTVNLSLTSNNNSDLALNFRTRPTDISELPENECPHPRTSPSSVSSTEPSSSQCSTK